MSTPECHVSTNSGNELVVITSIFGKRELINYVRDAVKRGVYGTICIYMAPELHAPLPPLVAHALLC